jgi:hypothetical protein
MKSITHGPNLDFEIRIEELEKINNQNKKKLVIYHQPLFKFKQIILKPSKT